ncbi:CopG-like DNA-binding protein [Desulfonatronospira thiodismutans ASO3-1]|uniref:CopG-like DNA-binding protein n=1 Tax=Desulfonatronospira thiodismutans ASO3-1 TaxID=555779 RepID=D6SL62_9BACT|nr:MULTISPECIES: hypothetical protein [Desulfonatronospira]EFI35423.1 CopG-like DNA-binding protein [Desulfonatronospira thiodismutans ASO3-1]RQD78042.1 MAG: hypothetical protein D5S03_03350 [Desulfonatronospira sp. MSAO_Bac3]
MANITLKVEDELLKKARSLAGRKNTSLNAVVRKMLRDFVNSDAKVQEAIDSLDDFYRKCDAAIGTGSWTRDELHER